MNLLRTPALVALPLTVLLTAGCGGSSTPKRQADDPVVATTAPHSGTGHQSSAKPGAIVGKPGGSAARTTAPAAGTNGQPGKPAAPQQTGQTATAPGNYTYDSKGKIAYGTQAQDTSGTKTLAVDKPSGANQHSSLGGDQGGGTQQDVVHRDTGTYLARLVITTGGFTKEFHPAQPVLGVPKPEQIGRTWSWSMTSTDGKTHAAYSAKYTRTEVVSIGGVRVNAWVIESTLKLTGDFQFTDQETVDYDPSRLLQVRQHQRGSGSYSGIDFTTDVTSTLRSVRPS